MNVQQRFSILKAWIRSNEGLTLKTSNLKSLYGGQITCIYSVDKTKH